MSQIEIMKRLHQILVNLIIRRVSERKPSHDILSYKILGSQIQDQSRSEESRKWEAPIL